MPRGYTLLDASNGDRDEQWRRSHQFTEKRAGNGRFLCIAELNLTFRKDPYMVIGFAPCGGSLCGEGQAYSAL
jgi:hypothetical protein